MKYPYMCIDAGKFEIHIGEKKYKSDPNPKDLSDLLYKLGVTRFMCSSTVDFSEEEGVKNASLILDEAVDITLKRQTKDEVKS